MPPGMMIKSRTRSWVRSRVSEGRLARVSCGGAYHERGAAFVAHGDGCVCWVP